MYYIKTKFTLHQHYHPFTLLNLEAVALNVLTKKYALQLAAVLIKQYYPYLMDAPQPDKQIWL
jgi:predicted acyltransferase